jgi:phenylacetate-CoA ligase
MLEQLLKHERMSQQQLLEKQQQDFQAIVRYAIEHSNFYQQKYAALSGNESIHINITDLPILRKQEVITNRDQILTLTDKSTVRLGHTGGSTGKPLAFWYDTYKMELMRAGMYRSYMWSGWQPGEKILNFWGAKQDFKQRGLAKKWHDLIAAEQTIGAWEYTDKQLQQWADHIRSWRPVLL